jgi:hypothetical protein
MIPLSTQVFFIWMNNGKKMRKSYHKKQFQRSTIQTSTCKGVQYSVVLKIAQEKYRQVEPSC